MNSMGRPHHAAMPRINVATYEGLLKGELFDRF